MNARYLDLKEYQSKLRPWLLENELENNLLIGVGDDIYSQQIPFLMGVAEEQGQIRQAFLQTPPHSLILSSDFETKHSTPAIFEFLRSEQKTFPGVLGPEAVSSAWKDLWEIALAKKVRPGLHLALYQLTKLTSKPQVKGNLELAQANNLAKYVDWLKTFTQETHTVSLGDPKQQIEKLLEAKALHVWTHQKQEVSMLARVRDTPHGVGISYVFTPAQFRKKGYARASVYALSQQLLSQGKGFCFLFADLNQAHTNRLYQDLGYQHRHTWQEWRC